MNITEWMLDYGWIPILIIGLSGLGFIIWIIIKLMQHFGVI